MTYESSRVLMAHDAAVLSNAASAFIPQERCITGGKNFCRVGVFTTGLPRPIAFNQQPTQILDIADRPNVNWFDGKPVPSLGLSGCRHVPNAFAQIE